jgi:hypothetical protein
VLDSQRLCFVDADHVESSSRDLTGFDVVTAAGRKLGEFVGLIVDPAERLIRYLVVHRSSLFGGRRLLVPMSSVRVDADHRRLRVELESGAQCPDFKAGAFPAFSDEDLLSVLFRRSRATQ